MLERQRQREAGSTAGSTAGGAAEGGAGSASGGAAGGAATGGVGGAAAGGVGGAAGTAGPATAPPRSHAVCNAAPCNAAPAVEEGEDEEEVQLVHEVTSRERDAQLRRQAVVLGDSDDDGEDTAGGATGEGTAKRQKVV